MKISFQIVVTYFIILFLSTHCYAQLDAPVYDDLKNNFLNIDPENIGVIDLNDYFNDTTHDFPATNGNNIAELKINESGWGGWYTYGGTHWTTNTLHGTQSLTRLSTGGSPRNNSPICGTSVGNSYTTATSCTTCWCGEGNDEWEDFSGSRLWIGAGNNSTFIQPFFPNMSNKPANRICIEIELPADRVLYPPTTLELENAGLAQIVNQNVSHDNIDWLRFEFGTYTTLYRNETSTSDEETGGTFQGGGSHFYHKYSSYSRYTATKAYAISDNTIVICMNDVPSGVRTGMRPSYNVNPLSTVVAGTDENGYTNAYSYISHLGRVYVDIRGNGAQAKYPLNIKYNKMFALYENNDIMAVDCNRGILGVDIIEEGHTATYPFTVYNNAPEDRTYRITMQSGGILPQNDIEDDFKIYIDENNNGIVDDNEITTELVPQETITFNANTDYNFIALHAPTNFVGTLRYGRQFTHAGITLQEVDRLRLTSYTVRTFIGSPEDVANKEQLLLTMIYPSPTSDYATYAEFNHELPNNPRMVKNSPDYIMAMQKMDANSSTTCSSLLGTPNDDLIASFNVEIYPNPAKNHINISFSMKESGALKITLYDVLGKTVNKGLNNYYTSKDSYTETINLSQLSNGIYFCKIQSKDSRITKKIVVDK